MTTPRSLANKQEIPHDDTVMSFFCPTRLGAAIKATEWDVAEEMERLVDIARNSSGKTSVDAMKRIREVVREVAELNGMITTATATQTVTETQSDGKTITQSASRLVSSLRRAPIAISEDSTGTVAAIYLPSRGSTT
jgi:hypothetical protein|tara:strand:+ start:627 stop:1037 length:411 start_codon:yes stop_codon:yes gene_type:complete